MSGKHRNMAAIAFFTVFFILLCLVGWEVESETVTDCVELTVEIGGQRERIRLFDDTGYTLYAFLPAEANPDNIVFSVKGAGIVSLNGQRIENGDVFSPDGEELRLSYRSFLRTRSYALCLIQTHNTASLHIETESGSMRRVHSRKKNTEQIQIALYDDSGMVYSSDGYSDTIRGHGNTTWGREKKPYNLYLSQPADLLGSGTGSNWVLLANYLDKAHLRNELIYGLARQTSDGWNPDTRFVDLYLDGMYAGLYQLTDKVEVGENRLELGAEDVFLNLEITERAKPTAVTEVFPGISAEVCFPERMTADRLSEVDGTVRSILEGLVNHSIPEERLEEYLDLDSWAWLYLIQEVSCNYDAGVASLYFYLHDGRLTAGPAWDYDNALGSWTHYSPDGLFARDTVRSPLWRALLSYDSFEKRVREVYCDRFMELLHEELDGGLAGKYACIADSVQMDLVRWNALAVKNGSVRADRTALDFLTDFLAQRVSLLDDVYCQNVFRPSVILKREDSVDGVLDYRTVQAGTAFSELSAGYATGLYMDENRTIPVNQQEAIEGNITVWADVPEAGGEHSLFGVNGLIPMEPGSSPVAVIKENINEVLSLACVPALAAIFLCIYLIDIRRRNK